MTTIVRSWLGTTTTHRLPAAQRKQELLDNALGLFAERGMHGVTMDAIAEAAGVTKPVVYQHFTSKRALYLELLEAVGAAMLDSIASATRAAVSPLITIIT